MEHLVATPAIRTRNKARHSELDEARAIVRAASIWSGVRTWVPVFWGRRFQGWMRGEPERGGSVWIPPAQCGQGLPFPSQDDAVNKMTLGQRSAQMFLKAVNTISADNWYDLWGSDTNAGNWSGTAATARSFSSTAGGLYTGGAVSPKIKYLLRASMFATEIAVRSMILYDRVLSYDKTTMPASVNSFTNVATATRYISTGDPGLQIFIEADANHSSLAANLTTLTYTNQAGTSGQSVNMTPALAKTVSITGPTATTPARSVIADPGTTTFGSKGSAYLTLAPGDTGVRSLGTYGWSAAPTGTCSFVLQFPLALLPDQGVAASASDVEFVTGTDIVNKRIFDDACLSWMFAARTTTATLVHGWTEFGWG